MASNVICCVCRNEIPGPVSHAIFVSEVVRLKKVLSDVKYQLETISRITDVPVAVRRSLEDVAMHLESVVIS